MAANRLDNVIYSPEELKVIDSNLVKGVVSRASTLSLIYSIAFFMYSFTSLEFLRKFNPNITLFNNTWPRIIFNSFPLLLMSIYFRKYSERTYLKAWLWTFFLPVIFIAACMIHVWPLIGAGRGEVYLYVHAANVFILTTAFVVVAPPLRFILAQALAFLVVFVLPLSYMFLKTGNVQLMKIEIGDLLIVIPAATYATYIVYKLRLKIAQFDLRLKKQASPFLGKALTDAIYNEKSELLENRMAQTVIVMMDIRGYTQFYNTQDPAIVREFMASYHGFVSRIVGQMGGYWHKSIGDAQLISFGAMDLAQDVSFVPGIENELAQANERRRRHQYDSALRVATTIAMQFDELKQRLDIQENISLGIAISAGEVEVRIQGDDTYKKELDINGRAVILCSRLEAYTKLIRKALAPDSSILVVSPELEPFVEFDRMFQRWNISEESLKVPNFPEIQQVAYHIFRKSERRENIRRLRVA